MKFKWNLAAKLITSNAAAVLVLGAILSLVFISFKNIETLVSDIVKKDMPSVISNAHIGNELTGMFADMMIGLFYEDEDNVKAKSQQFDNKIKNLAMQYTNPGLKASLEEFRPKLSSLIKQSGDIRKISEKFKIIEGDIIFIMDMLQEIISEHIENTDKDSHDMRYLEQLKSMGTRYREVFLEITVQTAELRGGKTQFLNGGENQITASLNYFKLSLETLLAADPQISKQGIQLIDMTDQYKNLVIQLLEVLKEFHKKIKEVGESKDRFMAVLKDTNEQIADTSENIRKRIDAGTKLTRKIIIILSLSVLIVSLLITYSVLNTFKVEGEAKLLAGEMELAKKIQNVLLPKKPEIKGYEIAASCDPADEVGGDYYDVISVAGYDWIVIGDVSGHGVTSGLVMMMVQTAIHTILVNNPTAPPAHLLSAINMVIYENIKKMDEARHMTIVVLAGGKKGKFSFSGLHEDIIVRRADTGKVEHIETDGFWIGMEPDISEMLTTDTMILNPGDYMVLFTDGVTEARCEYGMFGNERLEGIIENSNGKNADEIHDDIIDALKLCDKSDDVTLFVMKRI